MAWGDGDGRVLSTLGNKINLIQHKERGIATKVGRLYSEALASSDLIHLGIAHLSGRDGRRGRLLVLLEVLRHGGMLLVQGETARTGQKVTLEGRYSTRTDRNRRFRFRVRYVPLDCLAEVRAGLELYLTSIANCDRR